MYLVLILLVHLFHFEWLVYSVILLICCIHDNFCNLYIWQNSEFATASDEFHIFIMMIHVHEVEFCFLHTTSK